MLSTVYILSFFTLGVLLGIFRLLPPDMNELNFSFYALAALLFAVGFGIGHKPETINEFKKINRRVMLLPFFSMAGALLAVALLSISSEFDLSSSMAVASGFGYYSLSSVLITQYKGIELGTIALLANIVREVITLVFAPTIHRFFGKLAPIAAGGATSMDTTFPIISQTCGREYAVVSIYSGFVTDLSVPFLVTLFCMLG